MIFSKLAPELFPSIRPSVEYLAEEVPVPIPSADSEYENLCVHLLCCAILLLLVKIKLLLLLNCTYNFVVITVTQIGATLCDSSDASWRPHSQTENENGGHSGKVSCLDSL